MPSLIPLIVDLIHDDNKQAQFALSICSVTAQLCRPRWLLSFISREKGTSKQTPSSVLTTSAFQHQPLHVYSLRPRQRGATSNLAELREGKTSWTSGRALAEQGLEGCGNTEYSLWFGRS